MFALDWPGSYGQENDPPCPADPPVASETPAKRGRRSDALKLSADEAWRVRVAIRKLRRACGSFAALSAMTGIPAQTLRRAANPNGTLTGTLAGKLVVTSPVIGRAA